MVTTMTKRVMSSSASRITCRTTVQMCHLIKHIMTNRSKMTKKRLNKTTLNKRKMSKSR